MSAVALAAMSVLMVGADCASSGRRGVPQTWRSCGRSPAAGTGVVLDRVVAVVNGDVILESDVDEERRFEEIQPYRTVARIPRGPRSLSG